MGERPRHPRDDKIRVRQPVMVDDVVIGGGDRSRPRQGVARLSHMQRRAGGGLVEDAPGNRAGVCAEITRDVGGKSGTSAVVTGSSPCTDRDRTVHISGDLLLPTGVKWEVGLPALHLKGV